VAFAIWVIRWRWLIILFSLLVLCTSTIGAKHLTFSTNYRIFFSDKNPLLDAQETLEKVYSKDDNLSFIIRPASGVVFTPDFLADIQALTDASWKIPYTRRVDSLTNFQHSYAEGDNLTVEDLVRTPHTLTPAELTTIKDVALKEPLLVDRIISRDGTTTNVNVTFTRPSLRSDELPAIMSAARALASTFLEKHPDARVALTGIMPMNNAFFESGQRDAMTLVPLMYGVLLVVMALLLRSVTGTISTLLVIGFSAATAMGIAGWAQIKLTPISLTAPTIILTIAIADSIHLLVTLFKEIRHGATKNEAIIESLRINFGPVFLTSLTTVIGFLSLNFSDAPPFNHLGNITATGVTAAWLYSIFFLPALISVLPIRIKHKAERTRHAMDRLADFVIARHRLILIAMLAFSLSLIAMIPRIELNDQFVEYFHPSIQFRADVDFAREHLAGVYQANWSLPAGESGGISNPDYLKGVDAFSDWLRQQPEVVHVATLTDVFLRLNKNMHGDDPAYYRLPEERNLAAQYLLLYEMSLPYGLDLNNQMNVDKSSMRVITTLNDITTVQLRQFSLKATEWLQQHFPSVAEAEAISPTIMFAYISERNIHSMLTGTLFAFLLISLALTIALRSLKLGVISLVPNLIPAGMAFGIWSIFVGQVGLASAGVAATSLGLIVDATVHFLSKYIRARREQGASVEDGVRYAFSTVGTALWVTSG
jgi:predicted RND superfamily exporter protein